MVAHRLVGRATSVLVPMGRLLPSGFRVNVGISTNYFLTTKFRGRYLGLIGGLNGSGVGLILRLARHGPVPMAPRTETVFSDLRRRGVAFTLSSFNANCTACHCLRTFPISFVGVSGSFIRVTDISRVSNRVISGVIRLTHGPNLDVITRKMRARRRTSLVVNGNIRFLRNCLCSPPMPNGGFVSR